MDVTVNLKEILEQMQKNLECSICLELLNCPISTKCEHQFCRFCITKFLQNKRSVACPLCKKQITKRGFQERNDLVAVVNNLKLLIAAFEQDAGQKCSPTRGPQKCCPGTPDDLIESVAKCNKQKNDEASFSRQEEKPIQESCHNLVNMELPLQNSDHSIDSINKQERNTRPKTRSRSVKANQHPTFKEDRQGKQLALELKEKNTKGNIVSSEHKKYAKENKEDNYDLLQYLENGSCGANREGIGTETRDQKGQIVDANISPTSPSKSVGIDTGVTKCDAKTDDEHTSNRKRSNLKSKSKRSTTNVIFNKSLPSRTPNRASFRKLSEIKPHLDDTLDKNIGECHRQESETLTQQSCSSDASSLSSTLQLSKPIPPVSWTYTKRMQQLFKAEGRVRNWVDTLPKTNVTLETEQVEVKALTTKEKINAKKRTNRSLCPAVNQAAPSTSGIGNNNVADEILTTLDTETGFIIEQPVTLPPRRKSIFKSRLDDKQENRTAVEKNVTINEEADPYEFRGLTPLEKSKNPKKGKLSVPVVNKDVKHFPLDLKQTSTSDANQRKENKRKDSCVDGKNTALSEQKDHVTDYTKSTVGGCTRKKRKVNIRKEINKVDILITETNESFKSDGVDIPNGDCGDSLKTDLDLKEQAEELAVQKKSDSSSVSHKDSNTNECRLTDSCFLQENNFELIPEPNFEESSEIVERISPLETSVIKTTCVVGFHVSEPSRDKNEQSLAHLSMDKNEQSLAHLSMDKNEQSLAQTVLLVTEKTSRRGSRSRQSSKLANEPIPNKRSKICHARGDESFKGPATYAKTRKRATRNRNKIVQFSDCQTLSQKSSTELNSLIDKISQAEDYNFVFSTQDAIQKMEQEKTLDAENNFRTEVNTIQSDNVNIVNTIQSDKVDIVNIIADDSVDVSKTRPRKSTLNTRHNEPKKLEFEAMTVNMGNVSSAEITPINSSRDDHKLSHCGVVEETQCDDELSDTAQLITSPKESCGTAVIGHQTGFSESFSDNKGNYCHKTHNERIQVIQPEGNLDEHTDRFKPTKTLSNPKSKQGFDLYKHPHFEEMIHISRGQTGMLSTTSSPSTSVPITNTITGSSQVLTGSESQNVRYKLVSIKENSIFENNSFTKMYSNDLNEQSTSEFMDVESQLTENKTAFNAKDELSTSNLNSSEIASGSNMLAINCTQPSIIYKSIHSNSSEPTKKSLDVAQLTLRAKEVGTEVTDLSTVVLDQGSIKKHLVLVPDTCIDDSRKSDADISRAEAETVILDSVDLVESSSPDNLTVNLISDRSVLVHDSYHDYCNKPDSKKPDTVTLETIGLRETSDQRLERFKESSEVTGSEDAMNIRMTQSVVSETQSTLSPGGGPIQNEFTKESLNQSIVIAAIEGKDIAANNGTHWSGVAEDNLTEFSSPSQSLFKIKNQPKKFNCKEDTVKDSLTINCPESSCVIPQSESSSSALKTKANKVPFNILVEETQESISTTSTPKPKLIECSIDHSISSRCKSSNLKRQLYRNSDHQLPSNTNILQSPAVNSAPTKSLRPDSDEDDDVLIVRKSKRKCHSLDNTPLKPVVFYEKPKVLDSIKDVQTIGETVAMEDFETNAAPHRVNNKLNIHQVSQRVNSKLNIQQRISESVENIDMNVYGLLPIVCNASTQDDNHLTDSLIVKRSSNEAREFRNSSKHETSSLENSLQNNKSLLDLETSIPNDERLNPDTPTCQKLKIKRGLASKNNLQYLGSLPKHPKGTLTDQEKAALIKEMVKSVTDQESDIEIIDVDNNEVCTPESAVVETPFVKDKYNKERRQINSSVTSLKAVQRNNGKTSSNLTAGADNIQEDLEKKNLEVELFGCANTASKINSSANAAHHVDFYSEKVGILASNYTHEEEVAISFDLGVSSFDEKDEENQDEIEVDSTLNNGNEQEPVQAKTLSQGQVCLNCSIHSDVEIGGNESQPHSLPLTSSPLDGEDDIDRLGKFDQSEIEARDDVDDEITNDSDDDDDDDCSRIKKRSKRQQISSDSEASIEDPGQSEPNGNSSSVISSQSETLTTQQQLALEGDLEKLHQEIVKYEAELGKQSPENLSFDPKSEEDEISILRKKNPDIFVVDDSPVANNKDEEDSNDLFLSPEQVPSPAPHKKTVRTVVQKTASSQSRITEHIMKQFQSPGGSVRTKKHLEFLPGFNKTSEANQLKSNNFHAHSKSLAVSHKKSKEETIKNFETKSCHHNTRPGSPIISSQKSKQLQMSNTVENRCSINTAESNKICMVTSGFGREENMISLKFCEKFGATLVPTFTKDVSHVIMKPACGYELVCDRTLKFFQGLAHKCWVLAYSWLAQSLKAGTLLSEIDYEIEGDTSGGEFTNGAKHARLSQGQLFSDFCFACVGNSDEMPKKTLSDLLTVCGAIVVDDPIALISKLAKYKLIIRCSDSDTAPSPAELDMFNGLYKHMKLLTVMREWVLDSLGSYNLLPLAEYVLNTCDQIQVPF